MVEHEEVIRDVTIDCTKALFGDYEVAVEITEEQKSVTDDQVLLSVIGFGGKEMRGTVVLSAPEKTFQAARQGDEDLRDWAGEMSNQLLGRIKNRLLKYGVDLKMSTPIAICGMQVDYKVAKETSSHHRYGFQTDTGKLTVCVDAEYAPGFHMEEQEDADCPDEGELLFF